MRGVRQQESQWNKEGDAPHPPDLIPGADIRKPDGQKVDNSIYSYKLFALYREAMYNKQKPAVKLIFVENSRLWYD